jgi:hypothetical protein
VGCRNTGEIATHRLEPASEHRLLRLPDDDEVAIAGRQSQQAITHGAAHQVCAHGMGRVHRRMMTWCHRSRQSRVRPRNGVAPPRTWDPINGRRSSLPWWQADT